MLDTVTSFYNRLSKAQIAASIIVLFTLWSLVCVQWYVCGIRNLCEVSTHAAIRVSTAEAASEVTPCMPIVHAPLGLGVKNSAGDARNLAQFLNTTQHQELALDGIFGPSDHAAVVAYQAAHNLPQTGSIDETLLGMVNREACDATAS